MVFLRSVRRLLVAASVVPSSPILVTLMKEAPGSSETSVLTRATRRNNPEDTILHKAVGFMNGEAFPYSWTHFPHLRFRPTEYCRSFRQNN
jgi:hypothetical protein